MLDIHSHILPNVDDGAQNIAQSLKILRVMQEQGITDVIATPHFYPYEHNLEDFLEKIASAYELLTSLPQYKNLPNIYLGCELLYYQGISQSQSLKNFTINNSDYLLLELNPYFINQTLFDEILDLKNEKNIIPIIAHIERYSLWRDYKYLIEFVKENQILTQVNTTSFFSKKYTNVIKQLFDDNLITFLGTDSHSIETRPPMMDSALNRIEKVYGKEAKDKLLNNSEKLFNKIIKKESFDEI